MELHGSETEKNLMTALQGEALAHLKYQFYRSRISDYSKEHEQVLDEIAHNEKEHGKIWFKLLHEGAVPDDVTNLLDAFIDEKYEHLVMYPKFGKVAEEEGFDDIARLFYEIADIEGTHMQKFAELRYDIEEGKTFYGDIDDGVVSVGYWKCLNCGYQYKGVEALDECPICKHPKKYFTKL